MAIIYSYPLKTTVKNSDQFVISVAPTGGVGALETNSITFETLKDSILTGQTSGTVTSVTATRLTINQFFSMKFSIFSIVCCSFCIV